MLQSLILAELLVRERQREVRRTLETRRWLREARSPASTHGFSQPARALQRLSERRDADTDAMARACALACCG